MRQEVAEWYNFKPSMSLFKKLVKEDKFLLADFAMCGMDTVVREQIVNVFAREFTGMHWPLYGDSFETKKQFIRKFIGACEDNKVECGLTEQEFID